MDAIFFFFYASSIFHFDLAITFLSYQKGNQICYDLFILQNIEQSIPVKNEC